MRNYIDFEWMIATIGMWDISVSPNTNFGWFYQCFASETADENYAKLQSFVDAFNVQFPGSLAYVVAEIEASHRYLLLNKDILIQMLQFMTNLSAVPDDGTPDALTNSFNDVIEMIVMISPRDTWSHGQ